MFHNTPNSSSSSPPDAAAFAHKVTHSSRTATTTNASSSSSNTKRRRRPAGTPDPDAEVVSLSPKTLMESDRYVCEICNQGFQREQNLQMHRRRHKVPWKLVRRRDGGGNNAGEGEVHEGSGGGKKAATKRVYVCPEPTCLHHDPRHALGDLVGIKKHFRRKHSDHKQWVCDRCSKAYAVHSDYKAHLKTCGTRGHSCDCGRVFSRVESFIEHQDACTVHRTQPEKQAAQPACSSRTASSTSPSSEVNFGMPSAFPGLRMHKPMETIFLSSDKYSNNLSTSSSHRKLELQLLPSTSSACASPSFDEELVANLKLSIGNSSATGTNKDESGVNTMSSTRYYQGSETAEVSEATRTGEFAIDQIRLAMTEKALAEEARQQAKKQVELAEQELANAKRIRLQAHTELQRAHLLKEQATRKINSTIMQITCPACKQHFRPTTMTTSAMAPCDEMSLAMSYVSSANTEGEGEE